MRKTLLALLVALILLVGVIVYYLRINGPSIASRTLSNIMQVPVSIDSFDIAWNRLIITGLRVGNPPGGSMNEAFSCPKIEVDLSFKSLLSQTVEIQRIFLNNPTLGIELYNLTGSHNNWVTIAKNIQKQSQTNNPTASQKEICIRSLTLQPLLVLIQGPLTQGKLKALTPIPSLQLKNIGCGAGGQTYKEALNLIVQTLLVTIAKQYNLTDLLEGLPMLPENILETISPSVAVPGKIWDTLEGLFK